MATAREKLEELLRGIRQRQEQQALAVTVWRRALGRCQAVANALLESVRAQGLAPRVFRDGDSLVVQFPDRTDPPMNGARAVYRLDGPARSVEAVRFPHTSPVAGAMVRGEAFWSLPVPLAAPRRPEPNTWGPGPLEDLPLSVDTQEAFERSLVDFIEWALVREGAGPVPVRLP